MTFTGERRRQPRTRPAAHGLRITCYGREIPAILVDTSEGGLGVEMFVPLVAGAEVGIQGELHSDDFAIALAGTARVAYCRSSPDGLFRVGLSTQGVVYRSYEPGVAVEAES